jgi:hypothetical protein
MKIQKHYMIDGVPVPKKTYESRQIWWEYSGAKFEIYEKTRESKKPLQRQRRNG